MIAQNCKTCERGAGGCQISDCRAPDWTHHFVSRAALEAEVARLNGDLDTGCRQIAQLAAQVDAEKALHRVALNRAVASEAEAVRMTQERDAAIASSERALKLLGRFGEALVDAGYRGGDSDHQLEALRQCIADRDVAIARAVGERSERVGLEEQLAEAERRRDELRAQVARLDSERDRLREGLREALEWIAMAQSGRWTQDLFAQRRRLRALLGEAKEGGAS
jgi:cell division protein FtsB